MRHWVFAIALVAVAAASRGEASCSRFSAVLTSDNGTTMTLKGRLVGCSHASQYFPQGCGARFRCNGATCPWKRGYFLMSLYRGALWPRRADAKPGEWVCGLLGTTDVVQETSFTLDYGCGIERDDPMNPVLDSGKMTVRVKRRTLDFLKTDVRPPCRR